MCSILCTIHAHTYTVHIYYTHFLTCIKLAGDQKSSLQSGASNRNGRMRVRRRTQLRTEGKRRRRRKKRKRRRRRRRGEKKEVEN